MERFSPAGHQLGLVLVGEHRPVYFFFYGLEQLGERATWVVSCSFAFTWFFKISADSSLSFYFMI